MRRPLVGSRDGLDAWFAKDDPIPAFVRDEAMSAESYRAPLAGSGTRWTRCGTSSAGAT